MSIFFRYFLVPLRWFTEGLCVVQFLEAGTPPFTHTSISETKGFTGTSPSPPPSDADICVFLPCTCGPWRNDFFCATRDSGQEWSVMPKAAVMSEKPCVLHHRIRERGRFFYMPNTGIIKSPSDLVPLVEGGGEIDRSPRLRLSAPLRRSTR